MIKLLLLALCAVIINAENSGKCFIQDSTLLCTEVNELEFLENLKKQPAKTIQCDSCDIGKLPLQQLEVEVRRQIKKIVINEPLQQVNLDIDTFKDCENLQSLTFTNSSIYSLEPKLMQPLVKLEELHFIHSDLKKPNKEMLKYIPHLKSLSIAQAYIVRVTSNWFHQIPNLEYLNLSESQIGNITEDAFKALTKLQSINLYKNELKVLPNKLFDNLPNLKYLNISHNPISDIDIAHILSTNKLLEEFLMYDLPCELFTNMIDKYESLRQLEFETVCAEESKTTFDYKTNCVHVQAYAKSKPEDKVSVFKTYGAPIVSDGNFSKLPCVSPAKANSAYKKHY